MSVAYAHVRERNTQMLPSPRIDMPLDSFMVCSLSLYPSRRLLHPVALTDMASFKYLNQIICELSGFQRY